MNVKFSRLLLHIEASFVMCWKCYQPLSSESPHSWGGRLKSIPDIAENDVHWFSLLTHYILFHDFWALVWSIDKKICRKLEHPVLVFIHIWIHRHLHYNCLCLPHWKGLKTIHVMYNVATTFMVMCKRLLGNCRTGVPLWVLVIGCLTSRLWINLNCKQKKKEEISK